MPTIKNNIPIHGSQMIKPSAEPADTLTRALWIDGICDEFEAAWLAGQNPKVQDYLDGAAEEGRVALAQELIPLDIHHRRRRGEKVELPVTQGLPIESAGSAPLGDVPQATTIRI